MSFLKIGYKKTQFPFWMPSKELFMLETASIHFRTFRQPIDWPMQQESGFWLSAREEPKSASKHMLELGST